MSTRVVNRNVELYDVYIGRPSKWGNPFPLERDTPKLRDECMNKYVNWIMQQDELIEALDELKGKRLGCYCKPKRCHGDFLVFLVELLCD